MRRCAIGFAVAVAVAGVTGCGVATPDVKVPTIGKLGNPPGDSATFVVEGQNLTISQSGRAQVSLGAAPQLDHDGPLGCRGRYFTGHLTEHVRLFFSWSKRGAYLLVDDASHRVYRFPAAKRRGKRLTWSRRFPDQRVSVLVSCR